MSGPQDRHCVKSDPSAFRILCHFFSVIWQTGLDKDDDLMATGLRNRGADLTRTGTTACGRRAELFT